MDLANLPISIKLNVDLKIHLMQIILIVMNDIKTFYQLVHEGQHTLQLKPHP